MYVDIIDFLLLNYVCIFVSNYVCYRVGPKGYPIRDAQVKKIKTHAQPDESSAQPDEDSSQVATDFNQHAT